MSRAGIKLKLGATEAELAHDMGNSGTVLREHYINRLVSQAEAERCWRVLDSVDTRIGRIVKTGITKPASSLR